MKFPIKSIFGDPFTVRSHNMTRNSTRQLQINVSKRKVEIICDAGQSRVSGNAYTDHYGSYDDTQYLYISKLKGKKLK